MKFISRLTAILLAGGMSLTAQDKTVTETNKEGGDTFRILSSPYDGEKSDVPSRVFRLKNDDMMLKLQSKSLPDALHQIPGVYVQKTSPDRGAPIIRGFTSSRNVLVADGIRVNNPLLREGPNEYWSLLDPFLYQNVEVILGPGSVIYGSDAIGGVVLASSKALPRGQAGQGLQFLGGDAYFRYGSAQESFQEHVQMRLGIDDDLSFSIGLTRSDYGDLHMGNSVALPNSSFGTQAAFFRLEYDVDTHSSFLFGYDFFDMDDANRVHWTTSSKSYHGSSVTSDPNKGYRIKDMDRHSTYLRYMFRDGEGFIRDADFGITFQFMEEEETRLTEAKIKTRNTKWDDKTIGTNLRLVSDTSIGELTYGFDYYYDMVDSARNDGSFRIQGPVADDAQYHQLGIYLQDKIALNKDLDLILGGRYSWARMNANEVRDVPGNEVDGDWNAFTGTAHLVYRFNENTSGFIGVAQGFRAPNLSDTTRDGEFADSGSEVPSATLDPEYYTTYEAGLTIEKETYNAGVSIFYTQIKDMIVRQGSTGKDNMDGHLYGMEFYGEYWLTKQIAVFGNVSWIETYIRNHIDQDIDNDVRGDQMSKVPPLNGLAGIRWQPSNKFYAETYAMMANDQDDLSQNDRDNNASRIPPGGTPGYVTYNIRMGYKLTEDLDISLDLENLTDEAYRVHGSGQNGAGRSFTATLHYKF